MIDAQLPPSFWAEVIDTVCLFKSFCIRVYKPMTVPRPPVSVSPYLYKESTLWGSPTTGKKQNKTQQKPKQTHNQTKQSPCKSQKPSKKTR